MLRRALLLTSLLCCCSLVLHAQQPADSAIVRIRRDYAAVNAALPRCSRDSLDVFGMSTEGGVVYAWRCGGVVRKLVAVWYGETGQSREEFYLSNGQPFFVLRVEQHYARPFGRVVRSESDRYYLREGSLLRWLSSEDGSLPVRSEEASAAVAELRDAFDELMERVRTGRTDPP